MTTDDWRALVAELVSIDDAMESGTQHVSNQGQSLDGFSALAHFRDVAKRARVALTKPEPEWPTDEELYELWEADGQGDFQECRSFARAVLARWGTHSAATPIPLRERLPEERDCDNGCCWFGNKLSYANKWEWFYGDAAIYKRSGCTHWLPAPTKALPTIYE